jgi:hypothetical protein
MADADTRHCGGDRDWPGHARDWPGGARAARSRRAGTGVHAMKRDGDRDQEIAWRLTNSPAVVMEARDLIEWTGGGTDACLLARRGLEFQLGSGPDSIGEWAWRQAARESRLAGLLEQADTLGKIADTSAVLAAASTEWRGRYVARPATASERTDAALLASGRVRLQGRGPERGVDGAVYAPATVTGLGGASSPVVVVTTHAGTREVVAGFEHGYQRAAWLRDRVTGVTSASPGSLSPVSLGSCLDGHASRTALEEQVLASHLLGGGTGAEPGGQFAPRAFTTYARSEIYLAWRTVMSRSGGPGASPGDGAAPEAAVREELSRRLLRAPGWAAPHVGWPHGQLALAYLDRLAATPVTAEQGKAAARALLLADTVAAQLAGSGLPGASRAMRQEPRRGGLAEARFEIPRQRGPGDPGIAPSL